MDKAQLLFTLFRDLFLTIRQNSLDVTVCMIARSFYQGYFIHSLSTLYYYNAPSLATRLTGDYRDQTCTGKCGPALLDTPHTKKQAPFRKPAFYDSFYIFKQYPTSFTLMIICSAFTSTFFNFRFNRCTMQ